MPDPARSEERARAGLHVLVVDDEHPVLDELGYLLAHDDRVGTVSTAASGGAALKQLEREDIDAVFLDIAMPGLSGLDLARLLTRFKEPPSIVFVTAHDAHAVEAFELNALDYLLKPVRQERVAEAVRRIVETRDPRSQADEMIPVELAGVIRFIRRRDVQYAEAQGDYVRLHTADGSHLLRTPLGALEERWASAGFVRIHRSLLVAVAQITEVRFEHGRGSVRVGDAVLQVSRRHTAQLRDMLLHPAASETADTQRPVAHAPSR
jgi:DNA-binding LytR/AlgR family response regulator